MGEIDYVSEDSFNEEVITATVPVLVDFTAAWCGPCKMLDPIIRQLAEAWGSQVKVVKLDVDESPNLAIQYQVMGVPTLMLFSAGEPVQRMTGYQPKDRILAKLNPHL